MTFRAKGSGEGYRCRAVALPPSRGRVPTRPRHGDTVLKEAARPLWDLPARVPFGDGVPVALT